MQQKSNDVTQAFNIRLATQQLCDCTIAGSIASLLSIMELLLITIGYFIVVWVIAPNLKTNGLVPFMKVLLITFFIRGYALKPSDN